MTIAMKFPLRREAHMIYDALSRHVGMLNGTDFTGAQDEAHAAFLVDAANSNKALVEALERLVDLVERVGDSRKDAQLIDAGRAALAAAKGETR